MKKNNMTPPKVNSSIVTYSNDSEADKIPKNSKE
jgi:hypothetical protein